MPRISKLSLDQVNPQIDKLDILYKQVQSMDNLLKNVGFQAASSDPVHAPQTTNNLTFTWHGGASNTVSWNAGFIKDKNYSSQPQSGTGSGAQIAKKSSAPGQPHIWSVPAGSIGNIAPNTTYWFGWNTTQQTMQAEQDASTLHGNYDTKVIARVTSGTHSINGAIGGGGISGGVDLSGLSYGGVTGSGLTLETNGTLNSTQTLLNLAQGTGVTISESGGTVTVNSSGGISALSLLTYHWFNIYPGILGNSSAAPGYQTYATLHNIISVAPTVNNPALGSAILLNGTGVQYGVNEVAFLPLSNGSFYLGHLVDWQARVAVPTATSLGGRYWIGLENFSFSDVAFDSPQFGDIIGFRYSPNVPDTYWMACVGGNTIPFTALSTGVTPDASTTTHIFEVQISGSNALFFIDGVKTNTISITGLEITTLDWLSLLSIDNHFGAHPGGTMNFAWFYYQLTQ
jgi:hypothetical protein